ncbi:TIGR04104 family putative zinc finger protein [Bacillus sp. es.034]|uniref:TIGR04104 family putative zinc finger protein n=1 Tax=Bacillus sp. es.034 TaxID=1761763 RepID=UPI000BF7A003|nr:CXXC-20-CXXC protein [Bacillus sp. es.034]
MARCIHCKVNLSWFYIFKRLMIVKRPDMDCSHCGQKLYFTSRSKRVLMGMTMLIPVLFVPSFLFDYIPLFIVLVMGCMLMMPLFVTLTEKDDPWY